MRKLLVLAACLLSSFTLSLAQPQKHDIAIKLSLGLNHTKGNFNSIKYTNISTSPSIQYFISDRLSVGAYVDYSNETDQAQSGYMNSSIVSTKTKNHLVGPNISYHIPISKKFSFSLDGRIGFGKSILEFEIIRPVPQSSGLQYIYDTRDVEYNVFAAGITPTFNYYFAKHWALSLSIGDFGYYVNTYEGNAWRSESIDRFVLNLTQFKWSIGLKF